MGIKEKIRQLSDEYSKKLNIKIKNRALEMKRDDVSHYLIYKALGISSKEGRLIDSYQNKGRFLYKYAGSFLEEAAILCFEEKFAGAKRKLKVPNKTGARPKTFEIDCLANHLAYEIKWRDATTDGDHITKEHERVRNIKKAGYQPVRIMFYQPNREQAIRVQEALKTIYKGAGGRYYSANEAWSFMEKKTGVDLLKILKDIAKGKTGG